jgi:hypothetical protein
MAGNGWPGTALSCPDDPSEPVRRQAGGPLTADGEGRAGQGAQGPVVGVRGERQHAVRECRGRVHEGAGRGHREGPWEDTGWKRCAGQRADLTGGCVDAEGVELRVPAHHVQEGGVGAGPCGPGRNGEEQRHRENRPGSPHCFLHDRDETHSGRQAARQAGRRSQRPGSGAPRDTRRSCIPMLPRSAADQRECPARHAAVRGQRLRRAATVTRGTAR